MSQELKVKELLKIPDNFSSSSTGKDVENLVLSMLQDKTKKDGTALKTFKVERSSILDKVKTFLPQMEQSNTKLLNSTSNLNIEEISEEFKDSFIEMSFSCVPESPEVDAVISTMEPQSSDSSDSDDDEEEEKEKPKVPIIEEL